MAEVGYASLGIIPSFKGFGRELESGTSKHMTAAGSIGGARFGDAAGKSAGSRFASGVKKFGKVAAVGLAGVAAGAFTIAKDAVQVASDIDESTNKLAQVFGKSAGEITKYSGQAAEAIGQSDLQARNAAATFGIFGKAAKLTNRQNAKFAKQMTTLASDLASFHNASPEETIEALGSALRGEAEPMRKFGVLLDADTLKAEALAEGLIKPVKDAAKIKGYRIQMIEGQRAVNEAIEEFGAKSFEAEKAQANLGATQGRLAKALDGTLPALTQEQKILAARSLIMKQTSDAQGDFARTSDGLANQQRELSAKWEDAKIALGQALLPAVTEVVTFLNDKGVPAFERFSDWFVEDGIPAIKDFGGFVRDDVVPHLKTAGEFAGDLVGFLKDLPAPAKVAALATALGGFGALKMTGGGDGALGTAGKALGLAKVVKTFETNPLALGGGGKGGTPVAPIPGKTTTPKGIPPAIPPELKKPGFWGKALKPLRVIPMLAPSLGGMREFEPLMTDAEVKTVERYEANIARATEKWLDVKAAMDQNQTAFEAATIPLGKLQNQILGIDKSDPRIKLSFPGYSALNAHFDKLKGDIEWMTQPRYVRLTVTRDFADAGRQTRGGLQETTEGRRPAGDTFIHQGDIVAPQPRDYERWRRNRKRAISGGGVGGF